MLKKIAFLVNRADLDHQRFRSHWRSIHGPLVARSPGYERYRLGYAQNHVQGPTAIGKPFPWSGMAEFWLPGDSPNEDDFATTSIYRNRIAVDEREFIDMDATVSLTAEESRVVDGSGPAKLVVIAAPSPDAGVDPVAFASAALAASHDLARVVSGWTVNVVLPGTFRLPGARNVDDLGIDAVHELWFRSEDDRAAGIAALMDAARSHLDPDRTSSFLAEEIVFFQDGRPTGPAAH